MKQFKLHPVCTNAYSAFFYVLVLGCSILLIAVHAAAQTGGHNTGPDGPTDSLSDAQSVPADVCITTVGSTDCDERDKLVCATEVEGATLNENGFYEVPCQPGEAVEVVTYGRAITIENQSYWGAVAGFGVFGVSEPGNYIGSPDSPVTEGFFRTVHTVECGALYKAGYLWWIKDPWECTNSEPQKHMPAFGGADNGSSNVFTTRRDSDVRPADTNPGTCNIGDYPVYKACEVTIHAQPVDIPGDDDFDAEITNVEIDGVATKPGCTLVECNADVEFSATIVPTIDNEAYSTSIAPENLTNWNNVTNHTGDALIGGIFSYSGLDCGTTQEIEVLVRQSGGSSPDIITNEPGRSVVTSRTFEICVAPEDIDDPQRDPEIESCSISALDADQVRPGLVNPDGERNNDTAIYECGQRRVEFLLDVEIDLPNPIFTTVRDSQATGLSVSWSSPNCPDALTQGLDQLTYAGNLTESDFPFGCKIVATVSLTRDSNSPAIGDRVTCVAELDLVGNECDNSGPPVCEDADGNPLAVDQCNVCGGDNSTCADCAGVPNGTSIPDSCGICGGNGSLCIDCLGIPNGEAELDDCGVCLGDNSTCDDNNIGDPIDPPSEEVLSLLESGLSTSQNSFGNSVIADNAAKDLEASIVGIMRTEKKIAKRSCDGAVKVRGRKAFKNLVARVDVLETRAWINAWFRANGLVSTVCVDRVDECNELALAACSSVFDFTPHYNIYVDDMNELRKIGNRQRKRLLRTSKTCGSRRGRRIASRENKKQKQIYSDGIAAIEGIGKLQYQGCS